MTASSLATRKQPTSSMIETRTFKTTDLSSALANVTEAHDKETDVKDGDAAAPAREQGWAEPESITT